MKVDYSCRFDKSFKKRDLNAQRKIREAIKSILAYLNREGPLLPGLGLKNFEGNFWEIRVDIRQRIIFEFSDDRLSFWLVGNHDEVQRFMKSR